MTTLMRPALRTITRNTRDAHAGLLQQRGLSQWESGEKPEKNKLIERITHTTVPDHYRLALARWIGLTRNNNRFTSTVLHCENRLYIGLTTGSTLETGIQTHHSYGMPYLPGSSIKGAVRHYAEQNGIPPAYLEELFGSDSDTGEVSGALVWHDAWWLPLNGRERPYISEVITVHHQDHYNGKTSQADGSESPIPNPQIATGGAYYFVIEGAPDWTRYALGLLNATLEHQGLGSKTASGYGYFRSDNNAAYDKIIEKIHNDWKKAGLQSDPDALLRHEIAHGAPAKLADNLSKNKKKYLEGLGLDADNSDDIAKIAALVWEIHHDTVRGWATSDKKNEKKAYKLLEPYRLHK